MKKKEVDAITGRRRTRVLITRGLNCRPTYPINFNYARGMLIMHKPWSVNSPLNFNDKQKTIDTFKQMLENRDVPTSVLNQYTREVVNHQQERLDLVAKQGTLQANVDIDELDHDDAEEYLHHMNSSYFADGTGGYDLLSGEKVNIGLDHDWSQSPFEGRRSIKIDGSLYIQQLRDDCRHLYLTNESILITPTRKDGSKYTIDILSHEQRVVVLAVIDTVVKFLTNDEAYEPLRATVVGSGGTGKSLIINTIITIIREMTKSNGTVKVAAPSGCAAYNVGGCTLHSLLDINVQIPWRSLSEKKKSELMEKLENLLVFMIDERSMLNSKVVYAAEEHVRECVYNGHNSLERWGGVPVVLLFGDDYQLPPADKSGVIFGFTKYFCGPRATPITGRGKSSQVCDYEGTNILANMMTKYVFFLTKNFRALDKDDDALLSRLRVGEPTEEDADRLMNLHISHYSPDFITELENDPKCLWAFAKRHDMNLKNTEMLVKTSRRNNTPIARLRCQFDSNLTGSPARNSHFHGKKILPMLDICVDSQVCLETANIEPSCGLFVGSIGRVVEINYDKSVGPNNQNIDHLPNFVVVDIPTFKPPEGVSVWDENNPTVSLVLYHHKYCSNHITPTSYKSTIILQHVPIPPLMMRCDRGCCTATFMPMLLAHAVTIHRCQGMEAGYSEGDRWNRMVMDPSDTQWEIGSCCGTLYVSTSRGKTLGNKAVTHPKDSAIYWTGQNISFDRILNGTKKMDGQVCEAVKKRERWVEHLKKRAEVTTRELCTPKRLEEIKRTTYQTATAGNIVEDNESLRARIADIINSPNHVWAQKKGDWEVPRTYFAG
jgi:hypothetical protein